jgi:hypothetical protein
MSLRLADHWVWDSWLVEDCVDYHLFHARSTDLESWEVQPPTPCRSTIAVCTPDWCGMAPAAGCSSASGTPRRTDSSGRSAIRFR